MDYYWSTDLQSDLCAYIHWGKLHTISSRVYTVFYITLLLISTGGLILIKYLKRDLSGRAEHTVRLQVLYGFFLIMLHLMLPVFQPVPTDNHGNNTNITVMTLMSLFICIYRYISGRKHYLDQQVIMEQNRRLADEASKDSLTRLWNRRFFDQKMDELYHHCKETGTVMTAMMIDIDHFKVYNDTYGHQQGDECLRRMAWRLKQELDEKNEYLIRYGGEEFLYIGIGLDRQTAINKATHFNKVIRELIIGPSDQDPRSITISIGICCRCPAKGDQWTDYIGEADKALYTAKNNGRDNWVAI